MMENRMMTMRSVMETARREAPVGERISETTEWMLGSELRGSLNALLLCLRVLEGTPSDSEAREYARHIAAATEKVQRLLARRAAVQNM